jgi:hypothetical protein
VMAADEAHAAVTALEMQAPDDQVEGVVDLDVVLVAAEVGGLRPGDDQALAVCRADRYGAGRRPVDGDGAPTGLRVRAPAGAPRGNVEEQRKDAGCAGETLPILPARVRRVTRWLEPRRIIRASR